MRFIIYSVLWLIMSVNATFAAPLLGSTQKFSVSYAMYAGGFRALDMTLGYDFKPKTYRITMSAKPYGVIGQFLPWAGDYITNGQIKNHTLIPERHKKISRWREDMDQDSFVYKNGALVSLDRISINNSVKREYPVNPDKALHENAVDILTGALKVLSIVNDNKPCNGAPVIFDGKRRYKLSFTDKGEEELTSSKYNAFSGNAHVCEVEMIPLAGFNGKARGYYKIQEDARAKGQLPRVWLAPLWENGPYMPVKMLVKSDYGAVLLHLQKTNR